MAAQNFKRKLTAIMSADVAGYSRLMSEDEAATVKTLASYREIMAALIKQHKGRVVDSPGDNVLSEFASVVDAVQCAVAVQKEFQARNAELPENRRMEFRIGINLGDVIEEEDRIYGDGVNIAARLEALADPGGICVSKTAFDQIETKLPLGYEFLGEQRVKNIPKPVGAYRVMMEPRVTVAGMFRGRRMILSGIFAGVVVAIALGIWQFYIRRPSVEPASVEKMAPQLPEKPSIAVPRWLHGTWVNPDYNTTTNFAKIFFNRYGTWSGYKMDSDPDPALYGKFAITDKWTDPEGNIWLKERNHVQLMGVTRYRLMKLSTTGKTLEIMLSYDNYPTELDPNNKYYGIYQRQQ